MIFAIFNASVNMTFVAVNVHKTVVYVYLAMSQKLIFLKFNYYECRDIEKIIR